MHFFKALSILFLASYVSDASAQTVNIDEPTLNVLSGQHTCGAFVTSQLVPARLKGRSQLVISVPSGGIIFVGPSTISVGNGLILTGPTAQIIRGSGALYCNAFSGVAVSYVELY